MKRIRSLLAAASLACLTTTGLAADDANARAVNAARAQALLERAITHYRAQGEAALPAFNRVGQFHDGELYVYVLDANGVMLTSGGSSSALMGRNARDLHDTDGKPFIREILDIAAAKGSGTVEYRWLNRQHAKIERKIAYFQRLGDRILVVGYYTPRASAEQAKSMLWRAVHEFKEYGDQAIARFNDLNGGFTHDDLYVFVVGLNDRRMYAHGAQPRLVDRDVGDLKDVRGRPIIRQMIDLARTRGEGEIEYRWRNPVTGQEENKRTYVKRVGDYLVAVGSYVP